jgi:hypothetical protein
VAVGFGISPNLFTGPFISDFSTVGLLQIQSWPSKNALSLDKPLCIFFTAAGGSARITPCKLLLGL